MATNYVERLRPEYRDLARRIAEFYSVDRWNEVRLASAVHYYVAEKIPYVTRDDYLIGRRPFREFDDAFYEGGNCEEQTVLLGSLLSRVRGVQLRFRGVDTGNREAHILPQVRFPNRSREWVKTEIEGFFEETRVCSADSVCWEDGDWFAADPVMSSYLGDLSGLTRNGYVTWETDDRWEWTVLMDTWEVN